jgi:hypothetical protein
LLVARVGTDHKHPSVAADDLAFLTHRLDRRTYLHADITLFWLEIFFSEFLAEALATVAVAATSAKRRPRRVDPHAETAARDISNVGELRGYAA